MTGTLVMLSGLPGAGKSHLADALRTALPAFVLSVDPVENALYFVGIARTEPVGLAAYVVVEALAEPALRVGQTVVVDAVNDDPRARRQWRELADRTQARWRPIEVVCSDPHRHRRQLEQRQRGLAHVPEPTWAGLGPRRAALAAWTDPRLVVDSADGEGWAVGEGWAAVLAYVRSGDDAGGTAPAAR